jgi:hypothetical protein
MRRNRANLGKTAFALAVFLLLLPACALLRGAQGVAQAHAGHEAPAVPAASYTLTRWTVDGGGATSVTVGEYVLGGTASQPDADELIEGDYTLGGGFWGGGVLVGGGQYIYLPLVLKGYP